MLTETLQKKLYIWSKFHENVVNGISGQEIAI